MSRTTVKQAVAAWLAPPAVPFLNKVSPYVDKIVPTADAMGLQPGGSVGSGGLAWIWIPDKAEIPRALPYTQQRQVIHQVAVEIFFRSVLPAGAQASANFDALIEGLEARIRSDPTLGTAGTPTPIFSAGLGDSAPGAAGQADLRVEQDLPQEDNSSLYIWGRMRVTVVEFLSFKPAGS